MPKISDLDSKDKFKLEEELQAASKAYGRDIYQAGGCQLSDDAKIYGLCSECEYFRYIKYEFHGQKAWCHCMEVQISGSQRIVECRSFEKRGALSLQQMVDIAHDLSYLKKPAGRRAGF